MIDLFVGVGIGLAYTLGLGFTGFKMQQQKRRNKRGLIRADHAAIARRADRDHYRTLRGDPRGMYGNHTPPREFVDIADDDQFVDEWDVCELCPKRGNAVHPGKPVAVFSGTADAPVAPMRLCPTCYRECAYGSGHRTNTALPVPAPPGYLEDLKTWLEAESEWLTDVEVWLNAQDQWREEELQRGRVRGNNVADFQEARQRLGREMRLQTLAQTPGPTFAVGNPSPAQRTQAVLTQMMQKLVELGVPMAFAQEYLAAAAQGCPNCEYSFAHGDPAPRAVYCTGNCAK